jgi:hypothetical protein
MGHGFAGRCGECDGERAWTITRPDAVVSWACDQHLGVVCASLQRDWEVTRLMVVDSRKAQEWNGIAASLEAVAKEFESGPAT